MEIVNATPEGTDPNPDIPNENENENRNPKESMILWLLSFSATLSLANISYDIGIIPLVMLYMKIDIPSLDKDIANTIHFYTALGTIISFMVGAYICETKGRKFTIMASNFFQTGGAVFVASSSALWMIIIGRLLFGIGLGLSTISNLLYIAEWAPSRMRGRLMCMAGAMYGFGQFVAYCYITIYNKKPGLWRSYIGMEAAFPIAQLMLMLTLCPESYRWLYRMRSLEMATSAMRQVYEPSFVQQETERLRGTERNDQPFWGNIKMAFQSNEFRNAMYADMIVQVVQHCVGLNAISYLAEFSVDVSKFTPTEQFVYEVLMPVIGIILTIVFVEKGGRRNTLVVSIVIAMTSLLVLGIVVERSESTPKIKEFDSINFYPNSTCPLYELSNNKQEWTCATCLREKCGFCADKVNRLLPGACLANQNWIGDLCKGRGSEWSEKSCPTKLRNLIKTFIYIYRLGHSIGLETLPSIINSEIYPTSYLGLGVTVGSVTSWLAGLIGSYLLPLLLKRFYSWGTLLFYFGLSAIGLLAIGLTLPETQGQNLEDMGSLHQNSIGAHIMEYIRRVFPFFS